MRLGKRPGLGGSVLRVDIRLLNTLRRRAEALERARVERDEAVIRAHERGLSLRVIAQACDLTHEGVRKIVNRADQT